MAWSNVPLAVLVGSDENRRQGRERLTKRCDSPFLSKLTWRRLIEKEIGRAHDQSSGSRHASEQAWDKCDIPANTQVSKLGTRSERGMNDEGMWHKQIAYAQHDSL